MEDQLHPNTEPTQEGGAKKRPRIPFKHKISVKPSDLDEMNTTKGMEPEEESILETTLPFSAFDLDQDSSETELLDAMSYLDESELDDDSQDEVSGRRTIAGSDSAISEDEFDPEIHPEDDGDNLFGYGDEEHESPEEDDYKDLF